MKGEEFKDDIRQPAPRASLPRELVQHLTWPTEWDACIAR